MTNKEKIIKILKSHNIRMEIGGCGCCGSPWVSFEYNGEKIIDEESDFKINMFNENTSQNEKRSIS